MLEHELEEWLPTYQSWLEEVRPRLEAGEPGQYRHYPYVKPTDTPFVPFAGQLSKARIGVVSTAGFYLSGSQEPFTAADVEGDASFRQLPSDVTADQLAIAHTHYPHEAALEDWNVVLPLDRLRAMVAAGQLGSVGPVFSISGYCTDAALLCRTSARAIAAEARAAKCDAVLVVPV
jgi:D-proline reductase (dithiol) PrdB